MNEERQKEIKNRIERNKATYEKNEEERSRLLDRLGIKNSVLQKEMEDLQKEKADLDKMINGDQKIVADLDSTFHEREAAEARIEQHEREKGWITTRLNATERDLGLKPKVSLGKNKRNFQKNMGQ